MKKSNLKAAQEIKNLDKGVYPVKQSWLPYLNVMLSLSFKISKRGYKRETTNL